MVLGVTFPHRVGGTAGADSRFLGDSLRHGVDHDSFEFEQSTQI